MSVSCGRLCIQNEWTVKASTVKGGNTVRDKSSWGWCEDKQIQGNWDFYIEYRIAESKVVESVKQSQLAETSNPAFIHLESRFNTFNKVAMAKWKHQSSFKGSPACFVPSDYTCPAKHVWATQLIKVCRESPAARRAHEVEMFTKETWDSKHLFLPKRGATEPCPVGKVWRFLGVSSTARFNLTHWYNHRAPAQFSGQTMPTNHRAPAQPSGQTMPTNHRAPAQPSGQKMPTNHRAELTALVLTMQDLKLGELGCRSTNQPILNKPETCEVIMITHQARDILRKNTNVNACTTHCMMLIVRSGVKKHLLSDVKQVWFTLLNAIKGASPM